METELSQGEMGQYTKGISSKTSKMVMELLLGLTDANMRENGLVENNMEMVSIHTMAKFGQVFG